jgi:hypothetical protein
MQIIASSEDPVVVIPNPWCIKPPDGGASIIKEIETGPEQKWYI